MKVFTYNLKAFENVSAALENINKYNYTRKVKYLERAESLVLSALNEDSDYLDAVFYAGLIMDLIGKAADATQYFIRIIDEVNDQNIKDEAKYNLGVSYYHRYGHRFLEKAEMYFNELISSTQDENLKYLSLANLAQTYAMWMIPNTEQRKILRSSDVKKSKEVKEHIRKKFKQFENCEKEVCNYIKKGKKKNNKTKLEAIIYNARGMALMYYSDRLCDSKDEILQKLLESLHYLNKSEMNLPDDWANTCDLGSVHWKIALKTKDENDRRDHLNKAIDKLKKVIVELRPNYGFALYELGRINRTIDQFDIALSYFEKSLEIQVEYRDVGDKTINDEILRAKNQDASYP